MSGQVHTREELSAVQHRRRRWVAVGLALVMAVALCTGSRWRDDGAVRVLIENTGLMMIAVAVVGRAWCSLYIGGRKAERLVTVGPYSISRNPLYVFSFIGAFGVGTQSGSVTLGVVFLLATMAIFIPLIACEESYLANAMPRPFSAYRSMTPRLWPRPGLWRSPREITVRPDLFMRTLFDGLPFVVAWPVFEGIDALQQVGLLPLLLRWP
ncbi:methyltransferase family protein [Brevundimonas sp.]|uniref:methyltransferase family protein n=1 Tax=Brevundimonas sp. TaxID=1871086 RepID=UPI002FC985EC